MSGARTSNFNRHQETTTSDRDWANKTHVGVNVWEDFHISSGQISKESNSPFLTDCLSYLLGVELLDHRLQCFVSPPAVPAKTTRAKCRKTVQETSDNVAHRNQEKKGIGINRTQSGRRKGYSLIISTWGRPQLKEASDWSTVGCRYA